MKRIAPSGGEPPLRLDIIAPLPERWATCRGCETMARAAGVGLGGEDRGEVIPEIAKKL